MTLNGVMAVTLRYFTEFGKHTFQHIIAESSCGGIYAGVYCILLSRVRCRRKESSRSLSHLLMSFLYVSAADRSGEGITLCVRCPSVNTYFAGRSIFVTGYSKENLKIHTWSPHSLFLLPLFPFLAPSSPFLPSPPLHSSPSPFPSLTFFPSLYPSPPLEVGPLYSSYVAWGRAGASAGSGAEPQRGLGRIPSRNRFWCILAFKSDIWWQQFCDFPENQGQSTT